jgi:mycoredoxin-dependent peroxiredoxin
MAAEIGSAAPDFELRDQFNQPVKLGDFHGKKHVTLVFYAMSFSRVCAAELATLRNDLAAYQNEDAQLLAVSVDSPTVHRRFAEQEGYDFPLLSDFWPHGEVARRYGVFDEAFGVALRGTFLIDRGGIVRHRIVQSVADARSHEEVRRALGELA